MNTANTEQKKRTTNIKYMAYGCFGCVGGFLFIPCLVPFLCLFWLYVSDPDIVGEQYPVMPNVEQDPERANSIGKSAWREEERVWIVELAKEEGKDQLLVGTWQLESIKTYVLTGSAPPEEWGKTRLEIRPDYTFVLTEPYEGLDRLHNFSGMVTGQWDMSYNGNDGTLSVFFICETDMPADRTGVPAGIQSLNLWTLRENDMSDKYIRLRPCSTSADDYGPPYTPSWKKVIEEK